MLTYAHPPRNRSGFFLVHVSGIPCKFPKVPTYQRGFSSKCEVTPDFAKPKIIQGTAWQRPCRRIVNEKTPLSSTKSVLMPFNTKDLKVERRLGGLPLRSFSPVTLGGWSWLLVRNSGQFFFPKLPLIYRLCFLFVGFLAADLLIPKHSNFQPTQWLIGWLMFFVLFSYIFCGGYSRYSSMILVTGKLWNHLKEHVWSISSTLKTIRWKCWP